MHLFIHRSAPKYLLPKKPGKKIYLTASLRINKLILHRSRRKKKECFPLKWLLAYFPALIWEAGCWCTLKEENQDPAVMPHLKLIYLLSCTNRDIKSKRRLAANTKHVLFNELCKQHEVSHEKMRAVSPSLRHFMGGSVSGGLIWVTSVFPTSLPTSPYRSDDRTNVSSRLNLYLFSQGKQERIATIRLMGCFQTVVPLTVWNCV